MLTAAIKIGNDVSMCDLTTLNSSLNDYNVPINIYGNIGFVNHAASYRYQHLNIWLNRNNLKCTEYLSHYKQMCYNYDGYFITFGMLKYKLRNLNYPLFIRPNSPFKTFTGALVDKNNIEEFIDELITINKLTESELIYIAEPNQPLYEWRFFIVKNKIVSGSLYMVNGELNINADVRHDAYRCAEAAAKHDWQPDVCYVVDVGYDSIDKECKILELNSVCTSGLYACDAVEIIKAIDTATIDELNYA